METQPTSRPDPDPVIDDGRNQIVLRAGLVLVRRHPTHGLFVLPTAAEIDDAVVPISGEDVGMFTIITSSTGRPAGHDWQFVSLLRLQADLQPDLADAIAAALLLRS